MKLKLSDLTDAQVALRRLFDEAHPSAKLSYKLAMIQRALAPYLEEYGKAQMALLVKYGAKQTSIRDPGQWMFLDADGKPDMKTGQQYQHELVDLVSSEIDVNYSSITLDDLDHCTMATPLSPSEMASIWWLVEHNGESA